MPGREARPGRHRAPRIQSDSDGVVGDGPQAVDTLSAAGGAAAEQRHQAVAERTRASVAVPFLVAHRQHHVHPVDHRRGTQGAEGVADQGLAEQGQILCLGCSLFIRLPLPAAGMIAKQRLVWVRIA